MYIDGCVAQNYFELFCAILAYSGPYPKTKLGLKLIYKFLAQISESLIVSYPFKTVSREQGM